MEYENAIKSLSTETLEEAIQMAKRDQLGEDLIALLEYKLKERKSIE